MITNLNDWKKNKLNESKASQSIPDGTTVTFLLNGSDPEEFEQDEVDSEKIEKLAGRTATIVLLAISGDGDRDHEYYDIEFGDGTVLYGVSGYNLELVKEESDSNELESMVFTAMDNAIENGYDEVMTDDPEDTAKDLISYDSDIEDMYPSIEEIQKHVIKYRQNKKGMNESSDKKFIDDRKKLVSSKWLPIDSEAKRKQYIKKTGKEISQSDFEKLNWMDVQNILSKIDSLENAPKYVSGKIDLRGDGDKKTNESGSYSRKGGLKKGDFVIVGNKKGQVTKTKTSRDTPTSDVLKPFITIKFDDGKEDTIQYDYDKKNIQYDYKRNSK